MTTTVEFFDSCNHRTVVSVDSQPDGHDLCMLIRNDMPVTLTDVVEGVTFIQRFADGQLIDTQVTQELGSGWSATRLDNGAIVLRSGKTSLNLTKGQARRLKELLQ